MNRDLQESEHVVPKRTGPGRGRSSRAGQADVDELVTAVLIASRALVGVSARSLAEVEEAVTVTQFRTLVVLDNLGHINLLALAEELDVNSSTAMRMIDRLLVAGLVTREENPVNRREVLLGLTAGGTKLVETVTRKRRAEIAKIVTAMPVERRTELVAALHAFAEAASEPLPRPPSTLGW
jgi:DNA-binding MarR family transcriptional regulator